MGCILGADLLREFGYHLRVTGTHLAGDISLLTSEIGRKMSGVLV